MEVKLLNSVCLIITSGIHINATQYDVRLANDVEGPGKC